MFGGMSSYVLVCLLLEKLLYKFGEWLLVLVWYWGVLILLFVWLFLIGDLFCVVVGWLCLLWLFSILWMVLGKGVCYVVIVVGW